MHTMVYILPQTQFIVVVVAVARARYLIRFDRIRFDCGLFGISRAAATFQETVKTAHCSFGVQFERVLMV